ncbi:hypothetical protein HD554DRAFT_2329288 [Boletus coccyginus]|nr:hypothetical protein HD554DRAFT_2329288 [Boletus coccyginus]
MHHALYIEEILLNVFSHCYTLKRGRHSYSEPQRWYANVHLATLARTCNTFKEPALDTIWAELDDLTPLVRCLPEASWVESGSVYSLQKRLEQTDWDIILGYARRVRVLPQLQGSFGLAADSIEALSNPPSSTELIFPNLRVVGLLVATATVAPLVRYLTNPKLTSISFEFVENLDAVISSFGERCPIVTNFHVSEWTPSQVDTTSDLICCWQNLCSVWCYDVSLNVDAVLHLSRLHYLHHAGFKVVDAVVDRIQIILSPASTLTFPTLKCLDLSSDYLSPIWRLLRYFRTPEVHDIFVGVDARPTAPDLMSLFVSLQEACTHESLNDLSLVVVNAYETPLANASPYYITFDHLRPLTVFLNIKSITLDIPCGTHLSERELLRLASSWPHLELFKVGGEHGWPESSAITPGGFLQFLERCRSLRVLYFKFDFRGYTEIPQGHPWRGLTMPKHAYLHLLDSPIDEGSIKALGVFFHVAPYPDFRLIFYFRDSERPRELCNLYFNRWLQVDSLARDLWRERGDLRRSLETRSSQ